MKMMIGLHQSNRPLPPVCLLCFSILFTFNTSPPSPLSHIHRFASQSTPSINDLQPLSCPIALLLNLPLQ